MNQKYTVYVGCMTYNQSSYIKDTLDGFCIQQTQFPFICGIIDDASTDGEPEVIREYLEKNFNIEDSNVGGFYETDEFVRIYAQHKNNKNCYFAVYLLKFNHHGKKSKDPYVSEWRNGADFVAICEGDDYWIDPMKLQKQVSFMNKHPEHSLCFCAFQRLLPSGEINTRKPYVYDMEECSIQDIILGGGGFMCTNSILYRNSLYVPYQTWAIDCPIGDLPLMLTLASMGKVGYLSDVMCTYRISALGSWSLRMASGIQARRNHRKAIIKMWRHFDNWSKRKYHWTVVKKIFLNQINLLKDELLSIMK